MVTGGSGLSISVDFESPILSWVGLPDFWGRWQQQVLGGPSFTSEPGKVTPGELTKISAGM
jgi:hypothetical protein